MTGGIFPAARGCRRCGGWRRCVWGNPRGCAAAAAARHTRPTSREKGSSAVRPRRPGALRDMRLLLRSPASPRPREGTRLPRPAQRLSERRSLPDPTGKERQPLPFGAPGPLFSPDLPTRRAGQRERRQPPVPCHSLSASLSRISLPAVPRASRSPRRGSSPRGSLLPAARPRAAPRSYLRRPKERSGRERGGGRRPRAAARGEPGRAAPPSRAWPLRCAGRRRSVRLSGAAASGEAPGGRGDGQRLSPPRRGAGPGGAQRPRQGWGSPQRGEAGDARSAAPGSRAGPPAARSARTGVLRATGSAPQRDAGIRLPAASGHRAGGADRLSERGCGAAVRGTRPPAPNPAVPSPSCALRTRGAQPAISVRREAARSGLTSLPKEGSGPGTQQPAQVALHSGKVVQVVNGTQSQELALQPKIYADFNALQPTHVSTTLSE